MPDQVRYDDEALTGQQCRDEYDYEQHVDYIHYNPVKHGYVERAVDWPYSSIHEYISKGILSRDWGYNEGGLNGQVFGGKL